MSSPPYGDAATTSMPRQIRWQQLVATSCVTTILQERRRLAAVQLLQQRLPVLMGRRTAILSARQQLAAWAPWLAQLHTIVGGLAAEAAAQLLAQSAGQGPSRPPAEGTAATLAASANPPGPTNGAGTARAGTGASTDAADGDAATAAAVAEAAAAAAPAQPPSVAGSKLASPRKSSTDSARPQTAAQPAGEAANAASTTSAKANPVAELAQVLAVQVRVTAGDKQALISLQCAVFARHECCCFAAKYTSATMRGVDSMHPMCCRPTSSLHKQPRSLLAAATTSSCSARPSSCRVSAATC